MSKIIVCALYHFVTLEDYKSLKEPLLNEMLKNNIKGTFLLAREGINGTIAGKRNEIQLILQWLKSDSRFENITYKESYCEKLPFYRGKVKIKKEIVTMGVADIDPKNICGTYVKPENWNDLISDPDVTVIDTRNDYEIQIGTFKNSINPKINSFRQFPKYSKENLNPKINKKVAMFCTGGIRCEKSTAYLKSQGFKEVYHLEGGILNYLEKVEKNNSLWQGDCFVFDNRVAVDHDLKNGNYHQCHACRMPLTDDDKLLKTYVQGVSCKHCFYKQTDEQRRRFEQREKQIQLAKKRGESHMGSIPKK